MFGSLFKAAVGTVLLPVKVVADAVTLGGELTDNGETYTGEQLRNIKANLDKALDPDDE